MFVSLSDLQEYTGICSDNDGLQGLYIESAEDVVQNYLGYDILEKEYTSIIDGTGISEIALTAKPVKSISSVSISGIGIDTENFLIQGEFLYRRDGIFVLGYKNVVVTYTAGYTTDNIPKIMNLTVLRIAALLQTERDGNIGVTSKTVPESGARTFVNTVNFNKYLVPLSRYRLLRV